VEGKTTQRKKKGDSNDIIATLFFVGNQKGGEQKRGRNANGRGRVWKGGSGGKRGGRGKTKFEHRATVRDLVGKKGNLEISNQEDRKIELGASITINRDERRGICKKNKKKSNLEIQKGEVSLLGWLKQFLPKGEENPKEAVA